MPTAYFTPEAIPTNNMLQISTARTVSGPVGLSLLIEGNAPSFVPPLTSPSVHCHTLPDNTLDVAETMIDEELYQQAADELNSDRRRPHLWARACALASDDHDEARFLYTNLRVEELIAERDNSAEHSSLSTASQSGDADDPTLALSPLEEPDVDQPGSFRDTFSLDEADTDIPSSVPAPSGIDQANKSDDFLDFDADSPLLENAQAVEPLAEPDPDLMADFVPEPLDVLDDSFTGDAMGEEDFARELESFKAEEDSNAESQGMEPVAQTTSENDDHAELDRTARLQLSDDEITELASDHVHLDENVETADFTETHAADMTQANMDVLDAHSNELDQMLDDAQYEPPADSAAVDDMQWLESEPEQTSAKADNAHEPVIYEEDPYRDELNRQADELDLGDNQEQDYSQQIADELRRDDTFPEPFEHADSGGHTDSGTLPDIETGTQSTSDALPVAATVAATATAATTAAMASAPDLSTPRADAQRSEVVEHDTHEFPLDLTRGRQGKQFSIYRRNEQAQAVKNGVSWSALFLTLPYLLYRQLFGTALAYVAVWIIAIGGLLLSALAWIDAGSSVTPLIQACTIGFGLLAFIGLIYLPFRHANTWRSEKLENRGFELVATAKARNPGRAIARARRHAALG